MSELAVHAENYLRLRRALGHELEDAARLLPRFVAYLDDVGADTITVDTALAWVQSRDADPASTVWFRRMTVARGFARHMSGIDAATQVPPPGLVTYQQRWRPPFIYSEPDLEALIAAVPGLIPTPLRAATMQSLIGILAATGMRVGEAIRLQRCDADLSDGVLTVRASKFNRSRELPLHPSTVEALSAYATIRDRHVPHTASPNFYLSRKGTPVIYTDFGTVFRRLLTATGVGAESAVRPRVHDLRHSFAVHALMRWYQAGENVSALLPRLSTYLGHVAPAYTYWYLSAAPELLALAAARLETGDRP
jgi:integrase